MASEVLRSIVLAFGNDICNNRRLAMVDDTFTENYVHNDPALPGIRDRAAFKRALAYVLVAIPGLRITIEESFVSRSVVVARWLARDPYRSGSASGCQGITICHFDGNRITEAWWNYDTSSLALPASALPEPQEDDRRHAGRTTNREYIQMNPNDFKDLIRTYTEDVWNRANPAAISTYYAAAYINHDVAAPNVRTLDEYRQWVESILTGFAGLTVTIDSLAADGDICAKRYTLGATHVGPIAGVPPTGKPVRFSGVATYRVRDGKIAECWWNYDFFGFLVQLGVLPAPASS
jgi:steroid delta-isomerase-like uncharacterized protein